MKRFIIKISFYFVPFICVLVFYRFFIFTNISGDIGNLAQLQFKKQYNKMLDDSTLQNYIVFDTLINKLSPLRFKNKPAILTIGDSFSQLNKAGYQNYLAYLFNYEIVNSKRSSPESNPIQNAVSFLNSGIIDSTTCHIIIIESVDRGLFRRLANIDFSKAFVSFTPSKEKKEKSNSNFNLLQLTSFIRLKFGYENPIFQYKLTDNYFTHAWGHIAFCYYEDLLFTKISQKDINRAKENLIKLNEKFAEKSMKMIFLIAADKYDVYRPFMQDKTLPVDTSSDDFDKIPNVCVINTKSMLQDMVRNGVKDVYKINDTHWSYKASEVVARKLAHDIDSLEILKLQ